MTAGRAITEVSATDRPRLARHVRLNFSQARGQHVLLLPETVIVLNDSGAAVVQRCDGRRSVEAIVAGLGERFDRVDEAEVRRFLGGLVARRCVELVGSAGPGAADD